MRLVPRRHRQIPGTAEPPPLLLRIPALGRQRQVGLYSPLAIYLALLVSSRQTRDPISEGGEWLIFIIYRKPSKLNDYDTNKAVRK